MHLSLKVKLTALFVTVLGGSLIAYGVYFSSYINTLYKDEFDIMLYNFAVEVGQAIDVDLLGDITISKDVLQEERKIFPFSLGEVVMQVRSISGSSVARSRNLAPMQLPFEPDKIFSKARFDTWVAPKPINGHRHFRTVDILLRRQQRPIYILQIAAPDHFIQLNTQKINGTFFYSIPLILLLSGILGFSLASTALNPIRKITDTANQITAKALKQRIELPPGQRGELWELAKTLNELLDRLEKAFTSQESFIAHASHQLKTPLAILRNDIEDLSHKTDQSHETLEHIDSMREEIDYLSRLVENLLILAKMDSTESNQLYLEQVRIDEILISSVERLGRIAKKKEIHLNIDFESEDIEEEAFETTGDANLLASLFEALLENAIKYSPQGGKVKILLGSSPTRTHIQIFDEGPGINEAEKTQIFSRFYRGKELSPKVPGSGLGLSVAKRIAELHEAELSINNRRDGAHGALVQIDMKRITT